MSSIRKKPGQQAKSLKYQEERFNIAKQILFFLNITNTNNTIVVKDVSEEIQTQILSLEEDIKKYFNVGHWTYFKKTINPDRNFISLTKKVMKDVGINMISSVKYSKGKHSACYTFNVNDIDLTTINNIKNDDNDNDDF